VSNASAFKTAHGRAHSIAPGRHQQRKNLSEDGDASTGYFYTRSKAATFVRARPMCIASRKFQQHHRSVRAKGCRLRASTGGFSITAPSVARSCPEPSMRAARPAATSFGSLSGALAAEWPRQSADVPEDGDAGLGRGRRRGRGIVVRNW